MLDLDLILYQSIDPIGAGILHLFFICLSLFRYISKINRTSQHMANIMAETVRIFILCISHGIKLSKQLIAQCSIKGTVVPRLSYSRARGRWNILVARI